MVYKKSYLCTEKRWCKSLILKILNILCPHKNQGKSKENSNSLVKISISIVQVLESYLKPSEEKELSYSDLADQVS